MSQEYVSRSISIRPELLALIDRRALELGQSRSAYLCSLAEADLLQTGKITQEWYDQFVTGS